MVTHSSVLAWRIPGTAEPGGLPSMGSYKVGHDWSDAAAAAAAAAAAGGSFPVSQFFTSSGQSIEISVSASVLPMTIQDWFPLGWTGWVSLQSKGLSSAFSKTTVQQPQFFGLQLSSQCNSHIHTWVLEKPYWKNHWVDGSFSAK